MLFLSFIRPVEDDLLSFHTTIIHDIIAQWHMIYYLFSKTIILLFCHLGNSDKFYRYDIKILHIMSSSSSDPYLNLSVSISSSLVGVESLPLGLTTVGKGGKVFPSWVSSRLECHSVPRIFHWYLTLYSLEKLSFFVGAFSIVLWSWAFYPGNS